MELGTGGWHVAFAAGRHAGRMQERILSRLDTDGSGGLTRDEIGDRSRLAARFDRIDTDSDGALTGSEIGDHFMRRFALGGHHGHGMGWMYGVGREDREDAAAVAEFDRLDLDGDGTISDEELQAEVAAQEAARAAEEARQAKIAEIGRMDLDGDGALSVEELQAELALRAEARAVAQFDALDGDGDGAISDAEIGMGIEVANAEGGGVAETGEAVAAAETGAAEPFDPAATEAEAAAAAAAAAQASRDEAVLTLFENAFTAMLGGEDVPGDLPAMSQALYAEAQQILMQSIAQAEQTAA
ncbi:hypothetical protein HKCCE2091_07175 [Rhodobacterales bacterium HKCCE2091]|nr:hypothetical protein [Rhodobacterales bacterium HKCCE2091]